MQFAASTTIDSSQPLKRWRSRKFANLLPQSCPGIFMTGPTSRSVAKVCFVSFENSRVYTELSCFVSVVTILPSPKSFKINPRTDAKLTDVFGCTRTNCTRGVNPRKDIRYLCRNLANNSGLPFRSIRSRKLATAR